MQSYYRIQIIHVKGEEFSREVKDEDISMNLRWENWAW